jgi:DNA-binding response OmpR family regulator
MSAKILVIEDCTESYQLVCRALGNSYVLQRASNMAEATRHINKNRYDLILSDVMLPDGDGFKLCSLLQTHDEVRMTPVIFLTSKNAVSDKVLGFQVGGDDFITKPFDPLELKARIDAKIRKREREKQEANLIRIDDLEINKDEQRVSIVANGQSTEIDLTPIEFKILLQLAHEPNTVFSRDDILNVVWGENIHVYSRSVDTHVSKLRKKLMGKSSLIESVHGTGYRLISSAERVDIPLNTSFQDSYLAVGAQSL